MIWLSLLELTYFYFLRYPYQHHCHIVYICPGCSGDDQSSCLLKCMVSIILFQHFIDIKSCLLQFFFCIFIAISTGRISRSVGSVASDAENGSIFSGGQFFCRRKCKLLIASAESFSVHVNDRLASCDKGKAFVCILMCFCDR